MYDVDSWVISIEVSSYKDVSCGFWWKPGEDFSVSSMLLGTE
jgi:hypothetical protein